MFGDIPCIFHSECMDQIHAGLGVALIVIGFLVSVGIVIWVVSMISLLYELESEVNSLYRRLFALEGWRLKMNKKE